jgi:xyloglucan-specific exo-beta-1,4-glucanase
MYSPKRRLRLFRHPAWAGNTINDTTVYSYSWGQPVGGTSTRGFAISTDDTGTYAILASLNSTSGQQGPYVTTNGGTSWSRNTTGMSFGASVATCACAVARSSPNIMYCGNFGGSGGYIYKSTDYGATWTELTTSGARSWWAIACNSTGSIVVATAVNGVPYKSTNGGSTWTALSALSNSTWGPICVSEDGLVIATAITTGGNIYVSTNGGTSFASKANVASWYGICCSSDGTTIFAGSLTSGSCALSTDSGANWTTGIKPSGSTGDYRKTACSVSGNKLVAVDGNITASGGYIWVSQDKGVSWSQQASKNTSIWEGLAITSDGKTIYAGTLTASKPWVATGT